MRGQFEPVILELVRVLMRAEQMAPDFLDACILRAILSVQLCGTWQSGQLARARPERLEKWVVRLQFSEDVVAHFVTAGAESSRYW